MTDWNLVNGLVQKVLTLNAVFGFLSFVYLAYKAFTGGANGGRRLYLVLLTILISLIAIHFGSLLLLIVFELVSSFLLVTQVVSLALISLILAFALAVTLKHLTAKLADQFGRRKRVVYFTANTVLAIWAGVTAGLISGLGRSIAYHSGYAQYSFSGPLGDIARARIGVSADIVRQLTACRAAEQRFSGPPRTLRLSETSRRDGTPGTDIIYSVRENVAGRTMPTGVTYRYFAVAAGRQAMLSGRYRFNDRDGIGCEFGTLAQRGERRIESTELRIGFANAVSGLGTRIDYERARPIPWSLLAAVGALKDIGVDALMLDAANDFANKLDRALFWFQKIAFGLIIIVLLAPLRPKTKPGDPPDEAN